MDTGPTHQTFEISTSEAPSGDKTAPDVIRIVTETGEQLTRSYERLRWLGFVSMSGGLIVVLSFIFSAVPGLKLDFGSQVLFTVVGFCMLLLSAVLFALQNVHAFRLENRNRDFAIRSLELKYGVTKAAVEQPVVQPDGTYKPPPG